MTNQLTIEQRFALTRARYEVTRMSRPALEKTALRLLKSRMEQKNGVQQALMSSGIVFKIDEQQAGLPEIISEETFCDLLELSVDNSEEMPTDIMDEGWEDDDLEDDGLQFV
jgi:type II secretory pathway predicted ATPase ExeA|tara:strand:- start:221 stop:556 length:336 start_codon:yes stop_codon:yes gene_type:complete